jgi:hypothetical protein
LIHSDIRGPYLEVLVHINLLPGVDEKYWGTSATSMLANESFFLESMSAADSWVKMEKNDNHKFGKDTELPIKGIPSKFHWLFILPDHN